jgi:DNA-binding HxlR family transcriptional regulator
MQANSSIETQPTPRDVGHESRACPIGRAGFLLGDRWILLILRNATVGMTRFNDFRDDLGIADNILLDRLRRLVEAGVLVKVPYHDGRRTRQEYRLTQAGADLSPILRALGEWGAEHTAGAAPAPPMRAIHAQCGGELSADRVCSTCATRVDRDQEAWIRPWRSPTPQLLAAPVPTPGADGDERH